MSSANRPALYIGNKTYSSWSLRPWLALRHARIPFDEVVIPLDQPESAARLRAASPGGRVPALHDRGLVIWESIAILEYVADLWPAARLWPEEPVERAVARAVSAEMHAGFAALRQAMPMKLNRAIGPQSPDKVTDAVRADIARVEAIWTDCRRRYGAGGDFLFGRFTAADAMFAPVVTRFRTYAVPLPPVCAEYAQAIWTLPEVQEWVAGAAAETFRMARYE